jgi:hypothetical protein
MQWPIANGYPVPTANGGSGSQGGHSYSTSTESDFDRRERETRETQAGTCMVDHWEEVYHPGETYSYQMESHPRLARGYDCP